MVERALEIPAAYVSLQEKMNFEQKQQSLVLCLDVLWYFEVADLCHVLSMDSVIGLNFIYP